MTLSNYRSVLNTRFGGLLRPGAHEPNGLACALEVAAVARGHEWTDNPEIAELPDLRPLNDAAWSSDEARTRGLVPIVEAYWEWNEWSTKRRGQGVVRLAELTIRRVLPLVLRAINLVREADRCEHEGTAAAALAARDAAYPSVTASYAAAHAAAAYTFAHAAGDAGTVVYAAHRAANAAFYAARAAKGARAADAILITACTCWIDAVGLTETP